MIDFSKAPEDATHYIPESDDNYLIWAKNIKEGSYELNCPEDEDYNGWGNCTTKQSYYQEYLSRMIEIPSTNKLTVTCDNERQKMLCEQVIRMDKGEGLVQGFGFYDGGYKVNKNGKVDRAYNIWGAMIKRCYNKKYQEKFPTYKGCSVALEWAIFSNFKSWFDENYVEGWCLDKDLLIEDNKVYSKEACAFIPNDLNVLFTNSARSRGDLPQGVHFERSTGKFKAQISINGKYKNIGRFNNVKDAESTYKNKKHEYVISELSRYESLYGENDRLMLVIKSIRDRVSKPKKELVVPWEFIADWICEIAVDIDGCVTARDCHRNELPLPLKLDLTDIDLPVTVNRPEGK